MHSHPVEVNVEVQRAPHATMNQTDRTVQQTRWNRFRNQTRSRLLPLTMAAWTNPSRAQSFRSFAFITENRILRTSERISHLRFLVCRWSHRLIQHRYGIRAVCFFWILTFSKSPAAASAHRAVWSYFGADRLVKLLQHLIVPVSAVYCVSADTSKHVQTVDKSIPFRQWYPAVSYYTSTDCQQLIKLHLEPATLASDSSAHVHQVWHKWAHCPP